MPFLPFWCSWPDKFHVIIIFSGGGGGGGGILGKRSLSSSLVSTADALSILFPVLFCTEEAKM